MYSRGNPFFLLIIVAFFSSNLTAQTYTEVAQEKGIFHSYDTINFGGGVSFYDFDDDGWDDITLATAGGDSIHFYKNMGGTFVKLSALVVETSEVKQILWADVDNDGDQDLFTAVYGNVNYIYLNDGNLNFTPVQLPIQNGNPNVKTFAAAFGDYDVDGDLDLFIVSRGLLDTIPNQLLENDGFGNFTDITPNHFFDTIYQPTFCVAFFDYDKDGWPDIYTAEDRVFAQNQLYRNLGNGQFEDQTDPCGAGVWIDAMGLSVADYNHDSYLDFYISNSPDGNPLFHNNADGTFTDTAVFAGVALNKIAWSNQFLDYDNDMDLDIHVCTTSSASDPDKNVLFSNLGNGTFQDVTSAINGTDSTTSFSSGVGDINNDGYMDIVVSNAFPDSSNLWLNSGGSNQWVKINLEGTVSNRDGIGSWVEVYAGGQLRTYYTMCGTGFQGQNSGTLTIGLGTNLQADSIIVNWLSGIEDILTDVASNQSVTIIEGQWTSTSLDKFEYQKLLTLSPNPTNGIFNLSFSKQINEKGTVTITDNTGRIVSSVEVLQGASNIEIDLSSYDAGSYFISAVLNDGYYSEKILLVK